MSKLEEIAQSRRAWKKNVVMWHDGRVVYLSVAFTWHLKDAKMMAEMFHNAGYHVIAGGPAVKLMPDYFNGVAEVGEEYHDAVAMHNPLATFTSRGCIRKCKFCAVPTIEGELVELDEWPVRPIVCDNNLLACSRRHFDKVIDNLKRLQWVDFNQGLDARLLTKYHADRLTELYCIVRLAWDDVSLESQFRRAVEILLNAGMPKTRIRVYVLIGFNDTPEDALYRLKTIRDLGLMPNPMRYNPLNAMERDVYVPSEWGRTSEEANKLLRAYMRYWANLRFTHSIPFDVWLEKNT